MFSSGLIRWIWHALYCAVPSSYVPCLPVTFRQNSFLSEDLIVTSCSEAQSSLYVAVQRMHEQSQTSSSSQSDAEQHVFSSQQWRFIMI